MAFLDLVLGCQMANIDTTENGERREFVFPVLFFYFFGWRRLCLVSCCAQPRRTFGIPPDSFRIEAGTARISFLGFRLLRQPLPLSQQVQFTTARQYFAYVRVTLSAVRPSNGLIWSRKRVAGRSSRIAHHLCYCCWFFHHSLFRHVCSSVGRQFKKESTW